jgi:hypothetical protein
VSAHPPLTWGQVKAWAEANGITDDHLVIDQQQHRIRDLSETVYWPQEDAIRAGETADQGAPALMLQTRWG